MLKNCTVRPAPARLLLERGERDGLMVRPTDMFEKINGITVVKTAGIIMLCILTPAGWLKAKVTATEIKQLSMPYRNPVRPWEWQVTLNRQKIVFQ